MDRSLLDTDIFSEVLKGKNAQVSQIANQYRAEFGQYTISAPTLTEMVKGFDKLGRTDRVDSLVRGLASEQVLPLDRDGAVLAGRIYGTLEKAGQPIGRLDPLIAAIAMVNDLVLVTGNVKHFERVTRLGFGLKLNNWRPADPA
jgi:tRNA(fMet)-specific endonuclease VapC